MTTTRENIFSNRLREAMEFRRISQEELAQACRMQPATISHFVLGRRHPNFVSLYKLAMTLDVSMDYLAGISNVVASEGKPDPVANMLQKLSATNRGVAMAVVTALYQHQELNKRS